MWMCHVSYTNGSCHIYECVMSQKKKIKPHPLLHRRAPSSWPPATSHVHQYKWVMSQIRMSHVTDTNESCLHRHGHLQRVMSTSMNGSRRKYKRVMSQIRMSRLSIIVATCNARWEVHEYKWAMSRYEWGMSPSSWPLATRHVHTFECVMSQIQMDHVPDTNESCLHHRRHLQRVMSMNMNGSRHGHEWGTSRSSSPPAISYGVASVS